MNDQTEGLFEGWIILEVLGHRKLSGFAQEVTVAGSKFLRIDIPSQTEEGAIATQFYAASAIYCITPTTEEVARAFSFSHTLQPVTRWELNPAIRPTEDEWEN